MLHMALTFLVIGLVAALLGFTTSPARRSRSPSFWRGCFCCCFSCFSSSQSSEQEKSSRERRYNGGSRQRDPPLNVFRTRRVNVFRTPRFAVPAVAAVAIAAGLLTFVVPARGQGPASPALTILSKEGRRSLPLNIVNDQELVFLDDLASVFQLTVREESLGTVTVTYKGRAILLTPDQPLVSIAGRLVSLPGSPTRSGRRVMVPVEFINRALALIYDSRLDLRKPARLVIAGDLRVPRVTIRFEGGEPARLIVDANPAAASTVTQEGNSLAIRFDADLLDVVLPPIQPQPLLQAIRVIEPATLMVDLGPRFATFRATTLRLDTTTRTTIELMAAPDRSAAAGGRSGDGAPGGCSADGPTRSVGARRTGRFAPDHCDRSRTRRRGRRGERRRRHEGERSDARRCPPRQSGDRKPARHSRPPHPGGRP